MRIRATLAVAVVTALVMTAAPAHADPVRQDEPSDTWTADLTTIDDDDSNVTTVDGRLRIADPTKIPASLRLPVPEGVLTTSPHLLATPANRVSASVSAAATGDVIVEFRGQLPDGTWTEWRQAGQALAATTTLVQLRIVLSGEDATIGALTLTADAVPAPPATTAATVGLTYRVYATREGLVGGTTANGHVIASRDHFVALPSRRGLAPKNAGDYTVKLCTTSGSRCEYAPVWDVGPWNTTDDYWNPSSVRQRWQDLPQGRPEAQAAYQDGYNGGKDQYARNVANPAGIDLADGTFWDGLKLTDNSWVNVSYLWTGTGPRAAVGSVVLNIRKTPGTSAASVGYVANYARVPVECWTTGTNVAGPYRTTTRWNRLASGQFISHAYVASVTGGTVPAC